MFTFLKDRNNAIGDNAIKFFGGATGVQQAVAVKRRRMFNSMVINRAGLFDFRELERGVLLDRLPLKYSMEDRRFAAPVPTPPDYSAIGARIAALARTAFPYGVDKHQYPTSCGPIQRTLEQGGFTWLGAGHFSVVVAHPDYPDKAFKFGLKKEDSGAAYAAWCRANPGDHVPEVFHTERFTNGYFVVLPLLRRFREGEDSRLDIQYRMACAAVHRPLTTEKEHQMAVSLGAGPIATTASAIGTFFAGLATIDLHSENVMIGETAWGLPCIVITDPVSFSTSKQARINHDRSLPVVL